MAAVTVCWVGLCHTLGEPTPRYTASDTDITSTPVTIIRNALSPSTAQRLARSPAIAPTSQYVKRNVIPLHSAHTAAAACSSGTPS